MAIKKSFVIHIDMLDILDELDDKQAGKLFKAIRAYQLRLAEKGNQDVDTGIDWALDDFVTKIAFAPFKSQFDREFELWLETINKNRENVKKRWSKHNTKNTTRINGIRPFTKNTYNDNDSDNDSDKIVTIEEFLAFRKSEFEKLSIETKQKYAKYGVTKPIVRITTNASRQYIDVVEVLQDLEKEVEWKNTLQINYTITDYQFKELINDFIGKIYVSGTANYDIVGFKSHFVNWMKLKIKTNV